MVGLAEQRYGRVSNYVGNPTLTPALALTLSLTLTRYGRVSTDVGNPTLTPTLTLTLTLTLTRYGRVSTYFGRIQLGFGLWLTEAGVEAKDWSAAFRTPAWAKVARPCGGIAGHTEGPWSRSQASPNSPVSLHLTIQARRTGTTSRSLTGLVPRMALASRSSASCSRPRSGCTIR